MSTVRMRSIMYSDVLPLISNSNDLIDLLAAALESERDDVRVDLRIVTLKEAHRLCMLVFLIIALKHSSRTISVNFVCTIG